MAVPAGYTIALTINTLGVVGNVLGVNTTLYQCPTCRATTLDPNSHDAWHTSNAAAIKSAADAASAAAKTAANASSAAGQVLTAAQAAQKQADEAYALAQLAMPGADVTLCPLCRASVKTTDLRSHLTFHYRRSHGDPVDFPEDFDPTTQDLNDVDPPMRTNM